MDELDKDEAVDPVQVQDDYEFACFLASVEA